MPRRCQTCHTSYDGPERFCSLDGGAIVDHHEDGDELVGRTIDARYFVHRLIGRGGMGSVYEADHVGLDKRVALKFVTHADADARARFRQEARAASRVVHPNIVQVTDVGTDGDTEYLVMELVEGRDLQAVLGGRPMEQTRAVSIVRQVLAGLGAIHDAGLVHRDIKPANVLVLDDEDRIKLADFGIAKFVDGRPGQLDTGTGRIVGTPAFMAPEQLAGGRVDHRADLYAVGVMLFVMVAGTLPFQATSATELGGFRDIPAPDLARMRSGLDATLVQAVARALEKDPRDRFQDARAFADALALVQPAPVRAPAEQAPRATVAARPRLDPNAPTVPSHDVVKTVPRRSRRWLGLFLVVAASVATASFFVARRLGASAAVPTESPVLAAPNPIAPDAPRREAPPIVADASATAPPDAGVDAAIAARPARPNVTTPATLRPGQRRCECWALVGEVTQITCHRRRDRPSCECRAADRPVGLCPAPEQAGPDGASCDLGRDTYQGRPDETCTGYLGEDATSGRIDCNYCAGRAAFAFGGEDGDACRGYLRDTGVMAEGTLSRCVTEEEWRRK